MHGSEWTPLHRLAAACIALTLVVIPIQLVVFVLWPLPEMISAREWFTLLHDNPVAGLVSLDALLLLDWVLLLPVYLGLAVVLFVRGRTWVALALGMWTLAFAAFVASNPSLEMLRLAERYAAAGSESERAMLVAAGEALLVRWDGTAFQVSYVLGQLAGIAMGAVMLRAPEFRRLEAWLLIGGNAIGFGYYVPRVGLAISALSGLVLWAWYAMALRSFVRLGRKA